MEFPCQLEQLLNLFNTECVCKGMFLRTKQGNVCEALSPVPGKQHAFDEQKPQKWKEKAQTVLRACELPPNSFL